MAKRSKSQAPTRPSPRSTKDAAVYSAAIALAMVSLFLGTGMVTALGLACSAGLLAYGLLRSLRVPQRVAFTLATGAVLIAWLAIASARAVNPLVSATGAFGQHNGVALWVLGLSWLMAGSMWADQVALRWPLRVLVSAGALASVATLLEAANTGLRTRDYPAGFFESSSSLGQFAALALIAGVVAALSERSAFWRWGSWVTAALSGGAILVASSRGGVLAVVAALVAAVALVRLAVLAKRPMVTAVVFCSATAALLTLVFVAATGRLGAAASNILSAFGTGRGFIWRAGVGRFLLAPLTGSGLQQFTAWTDFFSINVGAPTADPHNVMLALLIGGGVIAGVLAFAAGVALTAAVLDAAQGRPFPAVLVLMLPLALFASAMVSWIHPVSMLATCAITGLALGRGAQGSPGSEGAAEPWVRPLLIAIAAVTSTAALLVGVSVPSQVAFSSSRSPERMLALYKQWPDPSYAVGVLRLSTPAAESGDAAARALIAETLSASERDTAWRVDLAGAQMQASRGLDPQNPARFAEFAAIANRGRVGNPDTAVWDVLLALEANRLGLKDEARTYAQRALARELDDGTKAEMERIAGGE